MTEPKPSPATHPTHPNTLHAQTLLEMNHCVSIARRDAAFHCLMEYWNSNPELRSESAQQRMDAYAHSYELLHEASRSAERSRLKYGHEGILERPTIHILKLLSALLSTIRSLASHIYMVNEEASILSDPMGDEILSLLKNTCKDFGANERVARHPFGTMLNVGAALLDASTTRNQEHFNEDDKRRYDVAFQEYCTHYREMTAPKNATR